MKDCIFCKIVKGELPSKKIYEDKDIWERAVYEIYFGITYMHSLRISHNDIKPDNIFFKVLCKDPLKITYRISDFGYCGDDEKTDKLRGTQEYLSPELEQIQNKKQTKASKINPSNPFSNDAYAMALTCLELLNPLNIKKNQLERKKDADKKDLEQLLVNICLSPEIKRLELFNDDLSKIVNDMRPSE